MANKDASSAIVRRGTLGVFKRGFGISSPGSDLEVKSSGDGNNPLDIRDSDGHALFNVRQSGNNGMMRLYSDGGSEKMRIRSSGDSFFHGGNIGIGTTTPLTQLDIFGGAGTKPNDPFGGQNQLFLSNGSTNNAGITIAADDGTNDIVTFLQSNQSSDTGYVGTQTSHNFVIRTNNTDRITVLSGGSVGIGTTSPGKLLELAGGGLRLPNAYSIDWNNENTRIVGSHNSNKIQFDVGGVSNVLYLSNGSVGIGTASPTLGKLQVVGSGSSERYLLALQSTNNHAQLRIISEASTYSSYIFFQDNSGAADRYVIQADVSDNLLFRPQGTGTAANQIVFNSVGNVGIGTNSPTAALHVKKAGVAQPFAIFEDTGTNSNPQVSVKNDAQQWGIQTVGARSDNFEVWDQTGGATRLAITTGGNVGIGRATPATHLEVYQASTTAPTLLQITNFSGGDSYLNWVERDSTGETANAKFGEAGVYGFQLGYDGGDNKLFLTSGNQTSIANRLTVQRDDGNVGIGTTGPAYKLHVAGDIYMNGGNFLMDHNYEIRSKDSGGATRTIARVSSNVLQYGWSGSGNVQFMGGGSYTERMRINASGGAITFNNAFTFPTSDGTANQVLQTDGSGTLSWSSAGTGTISGSGTDNYIPRFNGTGALENSAIYDNGSNRISLGTVTTSPWQALDVRSTGSQFSDGAGGNQNYNITVVDQNTYTYNYGGGILFGGKYNSSGGVTTLGIVSASKVSGNGTHGGKVHVGGRENNTATVPKVLTVTHANVGIGQVDPKADLHIGSSFSDAANDLGTAALAIKQTSTSAENGIYLERTGERKGYYIGISGVDGLTFRRNFSGTKSDIMSLTRDGNVGIGTVSPAGRLDVRGELGANGTVVVTSYFVNVTSAATSSAIYIGASSGTDWKIGKNVTGITSNTNFSISDHANNRFLDINSSGNVGIGTISPAAKLHVYLTGSAGSFSNIGLFRAGPDSNDSGAEIFVGQQGNSRGLVIRGGRGTGDQALAHFYLNQSGGVIPSATQNHVMTFLQGGYVGIGTTSPAYPLDVRTAIQGAMQVKGAQTHGLLLGEAAYSTSALYTGLKTSYMTGVNDYMIISGTTTDGNTYISAKSGGNAHMRAGGNNSTNEIVVSASTGITYKSDVRHEFSTGSVGIGTSSPTTKLHVYGNNAVGSLSNLAAQFSATGTGGLGIGDENGVDPYIGLLVATDDFHIKTGGNNNRVTVQADGNVGIGTNAPGAKLHVRGSDGYLKFDTSGADGTIKSDYNLKLYADDNNNNSSGYQNIQFYTAGANERMRITSDGNVGIGTTSPSKTLEINHSNHEPVLIKSTGNYNSMITMDSNRSSANSYVGGLAGKWNGTQVASIYLRTGSDTTNKDDGYITLLTASSGTLVERMRIQSDGNVGIGTTSPSYPLQVQYAGGTAIGMQVKGTSSRAKLIVSDNDTSTYLIAEDSMSSIGRSDSLSANNLTINSTGCVGVGTTSPTTKLHIDRASGESWDGNIGLSMTGTMLGKIIVDNDGLKYRTIVSGDGHYFRNAANNTNLVIQDNGRVGIGTTSPATTLHSSGTVRVGTSPFTDYKTSQQYSSASYYVAMATGSFHVADSSNTAKFTFTPSTGKFGIGITSPNETADVLGSIKYGTSTDHEIVYHSTTGTIAGNTLTTINWKNGTSTLDRLYTYKIELYISNDTNTNASAVYVLRDSANYASDTASWNLRMVSRTGTSSNHVAVEVASAGTVIQLKHFHPSSSYPIGYKVTANKRGSQNAVGAAIFGADSMWQRDVGVLQYSDGQIQVTSGAVGTPSYSFVGDVDTGMWRPGVNQLRLVTGGVDAIRIDGSQNVGIGVTANSANKLEVNGQLRASTSMFGDSSVSNVAAKPVHIKVGGQAALRLEDSTSTNLVYDISSDWGIGFVIRDETAGTNRLIIDQSTGDATFSNDLTVQGGSVHLGSDCTISRVGANILRTSDRFDATNSDGILTNRLAHYQTSTLNIGSGHPIGFSGNATFNNDVVITGSLTVNGTSTTIDTTNLLVEDPLIVLAKNQTGTPTLDAGIVVERGDSNNAAMFWDESGDEFRFSITTETGSTAGNVAITDNANIRAKGATLTGTLTNGGFYSGGNGYVSLTSNNPSIRFYESDTTDTNWDVQVNSGTLKFLTLYDNNTNFSEKLTITNAGTVNVNNNLTVGGTITENSSIAFKENVFDFTSPLEKISKVRPVKYNKKTNKDKKEIGLIAEELAEIFPELVENDKDGNPASVNYTRAVTVLFDGFKQMYKELKEIKEKIK